MTAADAATALATEIAAALRTAGVGHPTDSRLQRALYSSDASLYRIVSAMVAGTVALCHPWTMPSMAGALRWSDGGCEIFEGEPEPVAAGDVGGNVVVTAAQVLHEGVTGGKGPRRAVPFQSAMEEAVMSLSARDRQALDSLEDRLAGSDPRLASLMATFTRLTSGEEMPAREDIRAGGPPPGARAAAGGTGAETPRALPRRTRRRLGLQPAVYLLWLTVTITLITVTLVINHGGGTGTCTQSWAVACAGQAPAHSRAAADKTADGRAPRH